MIDPAGTQTIIVGIDESPRAADATAFAARLARVYGARLVLVAVYPAIGDVEELMVDPALDDAEPGHARMLARMAAAAGDDLDVTMRAEGGASPPDALRDVAEEERAGMIVLGSTHAGRLGRILPGSTGERLIHHAPCPVATAPAGYAEHARGPIGRIGVAFDHSAQARRALDDAVGLARATGAELRVMTAVGMAWHGTPALMSGPGWAAIHDELVARVRSELDGTVGDLPDDVEALGVVLEGDIAGELVHQTRRLDLLFTGSRAFNPLHAALVGGVSGRIMREAHCPVVLVPPGASLGRLELDGADRLPGDRPEPHGFDTLVRFLRDRSIECAITEHAETFTAAGEARAAAVPLERTAKVVMLRDAAGYVMAVVPASRRLDLGKLRRLTGRPELDLAPEATIAAEFPEFEVGAFPPFGALFGAAEVIDDALFTTPRVLSNGGDHQHSIVIDVQHLAIASGAQIGDIAERPV